MAKYEDFTALNGQYGLSEKDYSAEDLALAKLLPAFGVKLAQLKNQWRTATTPQGRALAHTQAENLRAALGAYSGGEDGSSLIIPDTDAYVEASAYNKVASPEAFSFDPSGSALYRQYLKEARRAGEDTLGKAAAMTGGTPSSYAVTASQQAYQNHMGDGLAEIYDRELAAYEQERKNREAALDAVNEKTSAVQKAQQTAYEQALQRAKTFGSVSAQDAELLGLAEGTLTQAAQKANQDEEIASLKAQITELKAQLKNTVGTSVANVGSTETESAGTSGESDISTKAKALSAFVMGDHSDRVINALLAFGALNTSMKNLLAREGISVTEGGKILHGIPNIGYSTAPGTEYLGSPAVSYGGKSYVWVEGEGYLNQTALEKYLSANKKLQGERTYHLENPLYEK